MTVTTPPGGLPLAIDHVIASCPGCGHRTLQRHADDLGVLYQCTRYPECRWEAFAAWADLAQHPHDGAPAPTSLSEQKRTQEVRQPMPLPTQKQSRVGKTPLNVRVLLAGTPKVGKSTLAAQWAPDQTLIIDTQQGTTLLGGEHYVTHVDDWPSFARTIDELAAGGHQFKTVVIDMIDDIWRFVDAHCAGKNAVLATATEDYNRSAKSAEGTFCQTIAKLLATGLGVWFLTHTKSTQDGNITRYTARLDQRVLTYVQGACEVVLLAESLGNGVKRTLHTAPTAKFEAGSRFPLPEPMDLDARALYAAMQRGLKTQAAAAATQTDTNENETKVAA